jgi:threonine-phosphate decarboxylase
MNIKHGGRLEDLSEQYDIDAEEIIDFSVNVNPLGMPESLIEVLQSKLSLIARYPDTESRYLRRKLANHLSLSHENIAIGNGSNELIYLIFRAYPASRVLIIHPTYSEYERGAKAGESDVNEFILRWQDGFHLDMNILIQEACKHDFVFLCNPNNPTGHLTRKEAIISLVSSVPQTTFIIDEAFIDFVNEQSDYQVTSDLPNLPNLIILRSMTKFFTIPGLRLGYLVADTDIIEKLNSVREPWSVNVLAQLAGEHLLDQNDYARRTMKAIQTERSFLINKLSQLSWLHIYPPEANFIFIRITAEKLDSSILSERLMTDGIAIRNCSNFVGLDNKFFRIAVKNRPENQKLIVAMEKAERDLL